MQLVVYIVLSMWFVFASGCSLDDRVDSAEDDASKTGRKVLDAPPAATPEELQVEMNALQSKIEAEIGDPVCEQSQQCEILPLGVKPCGGPWRYLVYSKSVSNTELLTEFADQYRGLNEAYNTAEQLVSDCMLVSPPAVSCTMNRCALEVNPSMIPVQ